MTTGIKLKPMHGLCLKLLMLSMLCLVAFSSTAKVKVEDYWSNDIRCVYSHYKDIKNHAFYHPGISLRIQSNDYGTCYLIVFEEFVSKQDDPSFQKGHRMIVRLGNNEVLSFPLVWEASPATVFTNAYEGNYNQPYIYPAYEVSSADIDKMIKEGIKKIRLEHSQGANDYIISKKEGDNKHVKANQKLMGEMWEAVKEQFRKPAPPKPNNTLPEF